MNPSRFSSAALALLFAFALAVLGHTARAYLPSGAGMQTFAADNPNIEYMGRIDFSDPKLPRFWSPGVAIRARFFGPECDLLVDDQVLWGNSHNYVEIALDGAAPYRVQLTAAENVVVVGGSLADGPHTVTLCKDTESGIGYLEFAGLRCKKLLRAPKLPARKIEFVGDSITVGSLSDIALHPCGTGQWYDQENTYMSYGPSTARLLNAQWMVTAVSGIGLVHSCCAMTFDMPDVYGNIDERPGGAAWAFSRYQPAIVTICLGQNDGEIDPKSFDDAYCAFVRQVRRDNPNAQIVLLTSPMAGPALTAYLKRNLASVAATLNAEGDSRVHWFAFAGSYNGGCDGHPDVEQHRIIAAQLAGYLRGLMHWRS